MKKSVNVSLMVLVSLLTFVGCTSKEEKAAELIRDTLSKTLYDFDSYSPIETKVTEAKASLYNDSTCWNMGATLAYGMQQISECRERMNNAIEHMLIWGAPSYYSSSYSDSQYYKYKNQYQNALSESLLGVFVCQKIAEEIKDTLSNLDTTQVIGWEVFHDFRCKTRGGDSEIGHYRYIISKDFKSIILCEDREGETDKSIREALETTTTDYWDNINSEE